MDAALSPQSPPSPPFVSEAPLPDAALPPLVIAGDLESIREITPWLGEVLGRLVPETAVPLVAGPIELALVELATNAVVHAAAPEVRLRSVPADNTLTVFVADDGHPFDVSEVTPPVPGHAQVHGYGLMIVEQIVDEVEYQRRDGTNEWRAVFALAPNARES